MRKDFVSLAFTLAEVLLALAIMGVLAAFLVPKLIASGNDNKKYTLMKESYSDVSQIVYQLWLQGDVASQSEFAKQFQSRMNYVSVNSTYLPLGAFHSYRLKNGATLLHYQSATVGLEDFMFDYNGPAGPNQLFDDQLYFWANWGQTAACGLRTGQAGSFDSTICPTISGAPHPIASYENFFRKVMTR